MTVLVPELATIDRPVVLDGELVAFGADAKPSQPSLCQRLLAGDRSVPVAFAAFDVLSVDGRAVAGEPYRERPRRLEALDLRSPECIVTSSRRDGARSLTASSPNGSRTSSPGGTYGAGERDATGQARVRVPLPRRERAHGQQPAARVCPARRP
jgi:hypothetical protein